MFHVPGSEKWLEAVLRTRSGRIILSALSCLCTTAVVALMVPIELRSIELARGHVETDAEVTDQREFPSSDLLTRTKYGVQYRFTIDGHDYFKTAPYGPAWSTLPKDEYDAATFEGRGHVRVIYAPLDPWNNDLARNLGGLRWQAVAWIVGLVSVTTAAWFWAGRVVQDEVRRWVERYGPPA